MKLAKLLKGIEVEKVIGPSDDAYVFMGSFWQEQPVVVHFLRRFGCPLCRGHALEISSTIPHLLRAGFRVVAIGVERIGMDEFVKEGYWQGELYIDCNQKAYKALELKSVGTFSLIFQALFNPRLKKVIKAKSSKIKANFKGNFNQLGGTFVFEKGGEAILNYPQSSVEDHLPLKKLLQVCNIDSAILNAKEEDECEGYCD